MHNRREFVKEMVAGVAVLGTGTNFALGEAKPAQKSRVVIVRDAKLRTPGPAPDGKRVVAMLDHAMQTYFRSKNPVQPWKQIVHPGQVVGLKVNSVGHRNLSPNVAMVEAICERLQQAGIKAGDIIVWDRASRDLQAAGYNFSNAPGSVRCFASDTAGYEGAPVSYGTVTTRLSKILTQCDVVINLPVLKNHDHAGVTMALKNMYGVINNPNTLHGTACDPYIADLNMIPQIRQKVRFVVGDMLTGIHMERGRAHRWRRLGCDRHHQRAAHRAQARRKRLDYTGAEGYTDKLSGDRGGCTTQAGDKRSGADSSDRATHCVRSQGWVPETRLLTAG
jgi:hypothetical protein